MKEIIHWVKRHSAMNVSCTKDGVLCDTYVQWLLRSDGLVWFRQSENIELLLEKPEADAPEKAFDVVDMLAAHPDFFKTAEEFEQQFNHDLYLLNSIEIWLPELGTSAPQTYYTPNFDVTNAAHGHLLSPGLQISQQLVELQGADPNAVVKSLTSMRDTLAARADAAVDDAAASSHPIDLSFDISLPGEV